MIIRPCKKFKIWLLDLLKSLRAFAYAYANYQNCIFYLLNVRSLVSVEHYVAKLGVSFYFKLRNLSN